MEKDRKIVDIIGNITVSDILSVPKQKIHTEGIIGRDKNLLGKQYVIVRIQSKHFPPATATNVTFFDDGTVIIRNQGYARVEIKPELGDIYTDCIDQAYELIKHFA